jgi:hypothetical protein
MVQSGNMALRWHLELGGTSLFTIAIEIRSGQAI